MVMAVDSPVGFAASVAAPVGTARSDGLHRIHMFGLEFVDAGSVEEVVDVALNFAGVPQPLDDCIPVMFTPNADIVVRMENEPWGPERALADRARFVLPDSQVVVFASRVVADEPLRSRLAGSSVFSTLWERLPNDNVMVIGPSGEVAERLMDERPGSSQIVPPLYECDSDEERGVYDILSAQILRLQPHTIVIGLSSVKSARMATYLADEVLPQMDNRPMIVLCGGGLEMHVGLRSRAPSWLQSIGFEWFYRFVQEPRRLFRRYFVDDVQFFGVVGREWRRTRGRRLL